VEGCVALVTGSNQGVGNGFVRVLLERGAKRVYATARRPETFPDMVALDPARVVPLKLDVTNDAHGRAAANMTQGLRAELDRDPILVAGVYTGGVDTMSASPDSQAMSPIEHAQEVLDALAEGQTSISAGTGSAATRQRVCEDPEGFERERIERFYSDPITIRRHL